jgi:hypothetical protein
VRRTFRTSGNVWGEAPKKPVLVKAARAVAEREDSDSHPGPRLERALQAEMRAGAALGIFPRASVLRTPVPRLRQELGPSELSGT